MTEFLGTRATRGTTTEEARALIEYGPLRYNTFDAYRDRNSLVSEMAKPIEVGG